MLTAVLWALVAGSTPQASPTPQVAVVAPHGTEVLPQLDPSIVEALEARGLPTTRMKLTPKEGSACARSMVDDACLDQVRGRWKRSQPPMMVLGEITAEPSATRVAMLVLHRDEAEPIARFETRFVEGDLVLPIVFPQAIADAARDHLEPPAPPTEQELEQLSALDEVAVAESGPVVSLAPPAPEPAPAPPRVAMSTMVRSLDDIDESLDLRRDFDEICRQGPRRRRASRDDSRDLRPRCGLGPVFGYVRPRTWVVTSLAIASGLASGLAFRAQQGPYGEQTRRKAGAWGTATAATSAVLGVGVVTLTISDRWQARRYIRDERWLAGR